MQFIDQQIDYFRARKELILRNLLQMGIEPKALDVKETRFQLKKESLKDLKIACIMDPFTLDSYAPECKLYELTPNNWKQEIESFQPDLLFVESAWQGKEKLWYRKIADGSKEYFELTSYCQEQEIPIVFWNKEDPVYTDTFMPAARMADFVFTTDIDCIKKYKDTLKHDRVYFLHFAAQPKIHNPIEKYERKDKFCFAGAYYHKYKKRSEVFDKFAEIFINTKGFDIYDRNYKNSLPEHAFPEQYDKYILGSLDPKEIDIAYKGYNYGINMNSVDQSQTMFARRVFEMLASNTVTIGNYSRGVKNLFGDLTISTNDSQTMEQALKTWCTDEQTYRKYRLVGLRNVLQQHLYEDRLSYIVQKVFNQNLTELLPTIIVFAAVQSQNELDYVKRLFEQQRYPNKKLYLVSDTERIWEEQNDEIVAISKAQFSILQWKDFSENTYVTVWNVADYYGENYLLDLVLTLRYKKCQGIGKQSFYEYANGEFILHEKNSVYKPVTELNITRAIISVDYCAENLENLECLFNIQVVSGKEFFSIDEFNYCKNWHGEACKVVDDLHLADQGIAINKIQQQSEQIKRSILDDDGQVLTPEMFKRYVEKSKHGNVWCEIKENKLYIHSALKNSEKGYIYIEHLYDLQEYAEQRTLKLLFAGKGSLDFLGVCVFYDKNKKKLSPVFTKSNRTLEEKIPEQAVYFKLGFRLSGEGNYEITGIHLGSSEQLNEKNTFLSRSNVLILTNQYPSYENLYRNMFVHKRMMAYKEDKHVFDVMRMNIYAKEEFSEFEGINIIEGQSEVLENILANGNIDTVCVHFLDRQMWEVLKRFNTKVRILVWVHGAEIQPWWRRSFNYKTVDDEEKAKVQSKIRETFWQEVFSEVGNMDIHFIFVSQYFAKEVFEDYKITLLPDDYNIIHNYIDTDMFRYEEKTKEYRKKILSIRPYASKIYANDLSVKCILELAKKPFFKDLDITLVGTGELLKETTKLLKKYDNVMIKDTFLRQEEIAEYHKQFGIFLVPSRGDSQGVSRDEAMASGLVPVTNAVAAIPEFVDETCGILAAGEDYHAMAEGIERLYNDPEYFSQLSKNAAERVRKQSSKELTIGKELELIDNLDGGNCEKNGYKA